MSELAGVVRYINEHAREASDAAEVDTFVKRVRLPGSGAVMRLFDRWEAWKARRVEAKAQAAFEAQLRWGWC